MLMADQVGWCYDVLADVGRGVYANHLVRLSCGTGRCLAEVVAWRHHDVCVFLLRLL